MTGSTDERGGSAIRGYLLPMPPPGDAPHVLRRAGRCRAVEAAPRPFHRVYRKARAVRLAAPLPIGEFCASEVAAGPILRDQLALFDRVRAG